MKCTEFAIECITGHLRIRSQTPLRTRFVESVTEFTSLLQGQTRTIERPRSSANVAPSTISIVLLFSEENKRKNCANPQNPYCLQCCKRKRFFILCHRSRALPKTIFTSGLQNGENFAFLRQFSAFYFFLLYFLCRLPFIIVQMLPFKRKLFWGLEIV